MTTLAVEEQAAIEGKRSVAIVSRCWMRTGMQRLGGGAIGLQGGNQGIGGGRHDGPK